MKSDDSQGMEKRGKEYIIGRICMSGRENEKAIWNIIFSGNYDFMRL